MASISPETLRTAFLIVVIFLVISLRVLLARMGIARRTIALVNLAVTGWLALTGILSVQGFFRDFQATPPKIALVILPALLAPFLIGCSRRLRPQIEQVPQQLVIALQSFRVAVEIILYGLAAQHLLPEIMTWNGRNFDILVGATAPIMAYFSFQENLARKKAVLIWNGLGLVILTNVVFHGLFSAPTAFQIFHTDPANTIIAEFPFIWLPTFVVPMAYFLHIVSIRKSLP